MKQKPNNNQLIIITPTNLHHEDLLLDDSEVIPRLQLDHLDGRRLATGQALGLQRLCICYSGQQRW